NRVTETESGNREENGTVGRGKGGGTGGFLWLSFAAVLDIIATVLILFPAGPCGLPALAAFCVQPTRLSALPVPSPHASLIRSPMPLVARRAIPFLLSRSRPVLPWGFALCVGITALAARSRSRPFEGLIQVSRLPAVV